MVRVLFLCTDNYIRSRLAEQWFNHCAANRGLQGQLQARSAGLAVSASSGNIGPMASEAMAALQMRGLEVDPRGLPMPHQVRVSELEQADLVVAVDAEAHRPMVKAAFAAWEPRIQFWQVKDLGEGATGDDPISQLQFNVEALVEQLSQG